MVPKANSIFGSKSNSTFADLKKPNLTCVAELKNLVGKIKTLEHNIQNLFLNSKFNFQFIFFNSWSSAAISLKNGKSSFHFEVQFLTPTLCIRLLSSSSCSSPSSSSAKQALFCGKDNLALLHVACCTVACAVILQMGGWSLRTVGL